jgi:Domain of unknown function (DUF6457)
MTWTGRGVSPGRQAGTGGAGEQVNTLAEWTSRVCGELGLDPGAVDRDAVLDLARDVAHEVARPAAPLTAFLLGMAVGRGQPAADAAARLRALARDWADTA